MRAHGTKINIAREESDLSLTSEEVEVWTTEEENPPSAYPSWSSRFRCLEAYACVIMGLTPALHHCNTIATYGVLVFGVYTFIAITIGAPLVFVEILLGRMIMGNVSKIWSMCPLAKGVLVCLLLTTGLTIVVYNVYNACIFKYIFSFLRGYIPWDQCRKPWARENCFLVKDNTTTMKRCILANSVPYCQNMSWESSGTQFWKYDTMNVTDIHVISLMIFNLALSTTVVTLINRKGHLGCEKTFRVLVYTPVFISFVLLFASYFSLQALTGFLFFLKFEWKIFTSWKMWLKAFEETLTSLTLATLALSCISSHGKFADNILIDVLVVIGTFIFSPSFFVIPVLILSGTIVVRYSAAPIGPMLSLLKNEEENLYVFVWMSEAVLQFPYPTYCWAFLFYLEILFICLGTQVIMVLSFVEALQGIFPKKKFLWIQIFVASFSFLFGVFYLLLKLEFELPIQTLVLMNILLHTLTWQVFYGYKRFMEDCHFVMGFAPPRFWFRLVWVCLTPLLVVVVGWKIYKRVPKKPLDFAIFIYVGVPLFFYLVVGFMQIYRAAKKKKKIVSVFVANPDWGPDDKVLKTSRAIFDSRPINKEFIYRKELNKKPQQKPPDFSDQNVVQLL